jgi:hypothetical protein
MYYDQVNDIYLVSKMGQIINVQRPVSSVPISGMYVILETAFTIALLGVLLYKYGCSKVVHWTNMLYPGQLLSSLI